MKKIFFFVLVIFLLLLITNTKALNRYRGSKEVKVVVSFTNSSVTTNDIREIMLFDYKIISYKPKLVLSYYDESILNIKLICRKCRKREEKASSLFSEYAMLCLAAGKRRRRWRIFPSEETLPDAGTVGGNIRWNYPGNIIPTEKSSAGEGNILTELLCQSKGI